MDESTKKGGGEVAVEPKGEPPAERPGEEASAAAEIDKLRQQLEAKELEAKENYDRFIRQVAELENFKKRMAREKEEAIRYANEVFVRDLLPILDNLERAVEHARGGGNGKPLLDGVEMIVKGFLDVLSKHGVSQISAMGQTFDPEKHEAIAQVESEKHQPNTVVEEHHKGYFLLDRLLRPSLVSVTKPPETRKKKKVDGEVENGEKDD